MARPSTRLAAGPLEMGRTALRNARWEAARACFAERVARARALMLTPNGRNSASPAGAAVR